MSEQTGETDTEMQVILILGNNDRLDYVMHASVVHDLRMSFLAGATIGEYAVLRKTFPTVLLRLDRLVSIEVSPHITSGGPQAGPPRPKSVQRR